MRTTTGDGLTLEEQEQVELLKNRSRVCRCGKHKTPRAHLCRSCATSRNLSSPKYLAWREAVLAGDDWTCQVCGHLDTTGQSLQAHHVENWRRQIHKRYLVSNGVTLCKDCHDGFHERFGKWGNTYKQVRDFVRDESWRNVSAGA